MAAFLPSLGQTVPAPVRLLAMVDTGASRTVVEEGRLSGLGTSPVGETAVHTVSTAGSPQTRTLYAVEVALARDVTGTLATNLYVAAVEDLSGLGVQALLGRDVLARLRLEYNGPAREFLLELPDDKGPEADAPGSEGGP